MTSPRPAPPPPPARRPLAGTDQLLAEAVAGDDRAFSALVHRHRPALLAHCRRTLGPGPDAEDAVQEALLRAWRRRGSFEGRSSFGWWLQRIATNTCIDIARRGARTPVPWDTLDEDQNRDPGPADQGAEARGAIAQGADVGELVAAREAVEHAYLVALRVLPAHQRAVLVLQDVLGHPAADTASLLGVTVASVNSALQRARATLRRSPHRLPPGPVTPAEQALVHQLVQAHEHADAPRVLAALDQFALRGGLGALAA